MNQALRPRLVSGSDLHLEGRFILGSPEECAAEVQKYQSAGIEDSILRCQWPGMAAEETLKAIEYFGGDVLSRVAG